LARLTLTVRGGAVAIESTWKQISARVAALRQAMETVLQGTTPDHAKWVAANTFVKSYNDIAKQFITIGGDKSINTYDISNLSGAHDAIWPEQKARFDRIYLDVITLQSLIDLDSEPDLGPMYNLIISGNEDAWSGDPVRLEPDRCAREYTSKKIAERYAGFSQENLQEIRRMPSIFAYEFGMNMPPKFGYIKDIVQRQDEVRIDYHIVDVQPFLLAGDLEKLRFELDISKLELYRTHWAIKEVDLAKELHARGITIPSSIRDVQNTIDIAKHEFDVALSFPGEARSLVEQIVGQLEKKLGPNRYFYDNNYIAQLARPSLDVLLQNIYSTAKLNVVFLGSDYQKKEWCGLEFRAIRELVKKREFSRVMYIRTNDGDVDGVFEVDGYVDARKQNAGKIADFIVERLAVVQQASVSK
jgi:hypothetical protein